MRDGGRRMAAPDSDSLLGLGIYSVPDAAHLTGIEAATLHRWLRGYHYARHGAKIPSDRVIHGELPTLDRTFAMSFLDLQEARCLQEFRKRQIGWKRLRDVHEKARIALGTNHPFSTGQFKTVGREIMRDFADEHGDQVLLDIARDQTAFREFLQPYLRGLRFIGNFPALWFPLESSARVVIDPKRSFGRPVVSKRGVPTSVLARSYKVEKSYERVARWYEVDLPSVKDAVAYEKRLARAA
jgi:uncharacterized protein (DUF433 family)